MAVAGSVVLAAAVLFGEGIATRAALAAIQTYQTRLAASEMRPHGACRFHPTCSEYGRLAIQRFGVWRGGALLAVRVLRCGPWTRAGTADPVPSVDSAPAQAPSSRRYSAS